MKIRPSFWQVNFQLRWSLNACASFSFFIHRLTMAKQILGFLLSLDISTFYVFDHVLCTFVNVCSMFHLAARHISLWGQESWSSCGLQRGNKIINRWHVWVRMNHVLPLPEHILSQQTLIKHKARAAEGYTLVKFSSSVDTSVIYLLYYSVKQSSEEKDQIDCFTL